MTVLLFMTQIKNRDTPIEVECAFKGKVIFCVRGVAIPPCGVPAVVGDHVPSSTVPALSQRRMVVVNVGSLASNGSCPMLSKQPEISASSVHSLAPAGVSRA
jgi:hypothetical protein